MVKEKTKDFSQNDDEETNLKTIRTYKDDIAHVMEEKKESLVSIAAAENKHRVRSEEFESSDEVSHKQHFKKVGIVVLSTVLFVLGTGSAFYFYGKTGMEVIEPKLNISSIILSNEEEEFEITNLSRRQILNELTNIKNNARLSVGEIKNVFITESFVDKEGVYRVALVSASDFLSAIDIQLTASFIRSLESAFMLGVHMENDKEPFLILKTSFYENAFAGMLAWEKNIKEDLAPLFGPANVNLILDEDFGTSTPLAVTPTFSDFVLKNKDVRILKDKSGETVLVYSFIDKNTIVITTNENTFGEILIRIR